MGILGIPGRHIVSFNSLLIGLLSKVGVTDASLGKGGSPDNAIFKGDVQALI